MEWTILSNLDYLQTFKITMKELPDHIIYYIAIRSEANISYRHDTEPSN